MSLIRLLKEAIDRNDVSYEKEEIERSIDELNLDLSVDELMKKFKDAPVKQLTMNL